MIYSFFNKKKKTKNFKNKCYFVGCSILFGGISESSQKGVSFENTFWIFTSTLCVEPLSFIQIDTP